MTRSSALLRRPLAVATCLLAAVAVTSCTARSQDAASSGAGASQSAETSDAVEQAALAAADAAGGPTDAPQDITIAMLRFVAQDESDQRLNAALKDAAEVLGWTVDECDGQGDPTTIARCMTTLVGQAPDAIVTDGVPQTIITTGLQQAREAGIPVVTFSGPVSPRDLYTANYAPDDAAMAAMLADYVINQLDEQAGDSPQMIAQSANLLGAGNAARMGALNEEIAASDVQVVAEPDVDLANAIQGTQSQMTALLTQYPDTRAIWTTLDAAAAGAGQAVAAQFPGQSFPDAPAVVTFYDNPQTLDLIRQGAVTATVTNPVEWTAWVTVDQLAEHFARNTELSQDERPDYGDGMTFWQPTIVTQDNLPAEGQLAPAPVNFTQFFTTKWNAEFSGE